MWCTTLVLNFLIPARLPWAVAPLFFYSLGMTLAMPSLTLLALDLFPAQRGMAASCQGFIQTATNSLTAAIIAPLICSTPLRLAFGQMGFLAVGLAATFTYAFTRRGVAGKVDPRSESEKPMEFVSPEG